MESKQTTPSKTMQTFLQETVQGKLTHSTFNTDCSFRFLPNFSTPPSRLHKIINPFEATLTERLHLPVFSPSVFAKVPSPKTEEKFKWTIDDISSLKPADIDETTVELFESNEDDSELESSAQAKIDKFFSEKHIVPSPWNPVLSNVPLISENATPPKLDGLKQFADGATQTMLTLPPSLPEHIEAILKPYFTYEDNQQQSDLYKNTSLYRKLFEFDGNEHDSAVSEQSSSPALSCNLSPIQFSPLGAQDVENQRHFGSPHDSARLRECNLSPIGPSLETARRSMSVKLNFSGHMSVDTSLVLVPDTLDQLPPNHSINFDNSHCPEHEVLSDSTVNWDMEYKHVSLVSKDSSLSEMDVSTSNTPRSRSKRSHGKKLSDSFLSDLDDETKENIYEIKNPVEEVPDAAKNSIFIRDDVTDAGYQTGVLTMSQESWSTTSLFASTPTKK